MKQMLILVSLLFVVASCSESHSGPSFVFKKSMGNGVAAKIGDVQVTEKDLYSGIENDLYEQEKKIFDIKFNKARTLLIEKLIDKDPNKGNLTYDQFMDKYIASTIKISEKDIEAFIKEKKIPAQHINDGIKERIRTFLQNEKKLEAIDAWLAKKAGGKKIEIFFEEPLRPTFEVKVGSAPTFGSATAKVTIVEFSDFQCPFCSKGAKLLKDLKAKYGNKIQVAFKNYPLPFHKDAKVAAMAGLCVHDQNKAKFWDMHDKMFASQDKLKPADLTGYAKELGVDEAKFNECLSSSKFLAAVNRDMEEGEKLGVKSTPTFFVNGMLVQGAQPVEVFAEIIDKELKK